MVEEELKGGLKLPTCSDEFPFGSLGTAEKGVDATGSCPSVFQIPLLDVIR